MDISGIRPQLHWACEALIPADSALDMPSALDAGVADHLLGRALKVRPDMIEPFVAAMSRLPAQAPAEPLAALLALGEADFGLVSRFIAGAYFLNEGVAARLGYRGQEALDIDPDYEEILAVTAEVQARGPIYRIA